jgi:hypothetical protein
MRQLKYKMQYGIATEINTNKKLSKRTKRTIYDELSTKSLKMVVKISFYVSITLILSLL